MDDVILEGIVRDTVTLLNFMPSAEVDQSSPRTIIDGEGLNYQRWCLFSAGQVGEFEIPYPDRNSGARRELGYILCHQGDNAVVRLLPTGRRTVVRSAHFTPLEKSPAIIKLIEDGISAAQKQRFNDLLAEINEFHGAGPAPTPTLHSPAVTPVPVSQDVRDTDGEETFNFFGSPPEPELTQAPSNDPVPEEATEQQDVAPTEAETPPNLPPAEPAPVLRRSQRAAARKPPGFYAEATRVESIRDYIACHMSAQECAAIYGKEAQEAAGSDEVINIVGRGALFGRDYRELTPEELKRVLPSFLLYKAKDLLPSETANEDANNLTWTTVQSKREKRENKKHRKKKK